MVDIIISIASKVAEYLVAPVGRQLGYLVHYTSNMAELRDQVEKLDEARESLQLRVDEATRHGDEILPNVSNWLTRANDISQKVQKFIEDEKKAKKSCFKGLCPNLISRYQLSRQAKEKALDVKKSHGEGHIQTISYRPPLPGAGSAPLQGYQAFESRASTLKKIMDALKDDKINKIGVWGMGGVGKTTLVKQVAKLAEDDKLFDKVVMVAVSREQNLGKIQTEIADLLDLKIKEESELGRAARLSEILKKKKLLIILDDIWATLKLGAVGIPHGEDHKWLKIVVTSRSKDVLSQDMGTQENFEVRLLSGDEAWQLFQDTAGDCIQKFNLHSVATKVAEKCGDLPIAIVTVAKALKDRSVPYWEDALRQLTSPTKTDIRGMSEDVYKSLELSYEYLENKDAKSLFLLCGLLGYGDISMDDLFKYSVGLRLFPSVKTLEDSANRLQVMVDSLKASSLLLDIHKKKYVKMHDVVRDVARDFASKDPHQFVVIEATQSEDWSEIRESTRYIHLSSSHQGTLVLPQTLVCPNLEFFLLVNERPSKNIPDSFFNGMGKLKVLHLFRMEFSSPPLSLQSLANLQTLCLDCCTLGDFAGIRELKQLEVLSFRGSDIEQLPKEIAQLTCLRLLDLSNCRQLQIIPPNILSNLSRLEHLCIEPWFEDAGLSELKHLCRLRTLNIALQDLELLPKDMVLEKLTRYKIFIGHWNLDQECETERALKICQDTGSLHLVDGIGKLLKKTEELSLWRLSGTESVLLYGFDKEDFLQLKYLDVRESPEIQYIIDSKYPWVQEHAHFPSLESLHLHGMSSLEKVCHGPIPKGSFGNLKTLHVSECHGLKIFLSLTMATGILHLEEIEIAWCNVMQQIIAYERESEIIEDEHARTTLQPFPKLRSLELYELPELMNFSSFSMSLTTNARLEGNHDIHISFFNHQVPNLETLRLYHLPKLKGIWHHQLPFGYSYNLKMLKVWRCPCLLNLIPFHLIHSLNHLKYIDLKNCEVLEQVFDLQGVDGNTKILPKLEYLELQYLPRLKCIISNEDKDDNVRYLFSPPTLMDFHNLKFLSIEHCGNKVKDEGYVNTLTEDVVIFGEKVSFPNLAELHLGGLPTWKKIWHRQLPLDSFSNLQILIVINCPCLLNLIPCHLIQSLKNLKKIEVVGCEVLKHVFDLQGLDRNIDLLPKLETLELHGLFGLKCVTCNESNKDNMRCLFSLSMLMNFQNLKYLSIKNCGKEDKDEGYVHTLSEDDTMLFGGKVSFPNLEELHLWDLPKLKEIWHHQLPFDSFSNLQILIVNNCPCLLNLIPCHLIQSFKNLKEIKVANCEVLKHIFDLQGLDRNIKLLSKLETLVLDELLGLRWITCNEDKKDNMGCLFSPSMPMNFQNFKYLSITYCGKEDKDEGYVHTPSEDDIVLFGGKVSFPNLEELHLWDLRKLKEIWHHQLPLDSFSNLRVLDMYKCPCILNLIPCHLIQRLENLIKTKVSDCKVLKHVFDLQGLDRNVEVLPKLETLVLDKLPGLRCVTWNEDKNCNMRCLFSPSMLMNFQNLKYLSIKNCGKEDKDEGYVHTPSEDDTLLFSGKVSFPNLEELHLWDLPKLKEIWHHQLPLYSFSNLQILDVYKCPCLLNLIPCHLIQRLENLKEIKVSNCKVLKHVFDFQGLDRNVELLPKLETLVLDKLPGLRCVIWNEDKNDNMRCLFSPSMLMNFRSLKSLSIKNCGKEDKDEGYVHTPSEDDTLLFGGKDSFPNLEELHLWDLPKLKEIWHHQLSPDSFSNLQILDVYKCPCLLNLIPCNLIQRLENLKEIKVSNCKVLKHVFDLQGLDRNVELLPKLETLVLDELLGLRCVTWNKDKNDNMRCLFFPSMLKNFQNLKYLSIRNCGKEDKDEGYVHTPSEDDTMLLSGKVSFPGVCYEAFESRASILNKIMDALGDEDINRIGVWGMGHVGKTTLLKQAAQQARQLQLFATQLYIDVSWTRDSDNLQQGISEIQLKIAEKLGLPLWHFEESSRASIVNERLQKEKILIILDDIWKEIDLEEVGIPSTGNEIECKIVLTSRDGDQLCKDMGAQICFQVEHLLPQEAWSLFKKTAGDFVEENLELRPIAVQVVEEYCEGLPIAILTIAKALKDETVAVWKNVLEELRRFTPTNIRGVGNKVYSCLEWSYTHLKGDDVKSLFLLCGMLGYDDISVDLLLQYCLGLDMFDHIDSLEQATNKLLTLVQILKASNLLFSNADNNSVRMHDVVSDVARAIAYKDPHPFIIREDVGFEEWSGTDESKRCTFITLNCKLVHELPHGLVCSELQIFLLQNNNPSLNIPNTFFEGMKKLKVLDLSKMKFATLPSSLDSLANLRTLRLDRCNLVDIAFIGKLTKLEVLSLVGSTIRQLPEEMMQLTNLRLLDLNDCEELRVIPRNILSSLSRLECLCMESSFTQWADEGESNASLSELNHLSHLKTLDICIPDAKLLPKDILFENLTRYKILINHFWWSKSDFKTKRALQLRRVFHLGDEISKLERSEELPHLGDEFSKLVERSEELQFMELSGTKYVLCPSDSESFLELKHLKVSSSDEIQYIIDSKDQQCLQHVAFPLLESLALEFLYNLEEVWHGPIPVGSFGNLKTLHVSCCHRLKFLFVLSTARGLSQLEEMKIQNCNVMQQIIACERELEIKEDGHAGTNLQLFPKLRTWELKYLPQLINFSSELETTSSTSQNTNAILEGSFFNHQFSFPILEELTLINLPKLKDIWFHQLLLGSRNLRMVKVSKCPYQLNLVSSHLQKIDVQGCAVM